MGFLHGGWSIVNNFQMLFKGNGQGEAAEGRGHAGDRQGEHYRDGKN